MSSPTTARANVARTIGPLAGPTLPLALVTSRAKSSKNESSWMLSIRLPRGPRQGTGMCVSSPVHRSFRYWHSKIPTARYLSNAAMPFWRTVTSAVSILSIRRRIVE